MNKKAASFSMGALLGLLLLVFMLVVMAAVFFPKFFEGGNTFKANLQCNTPIKQCGCSLESQSFVLGANGCPAGSTAKYNDEGCPKTCTTATYDSALKDATDSYKSNGEKDKSVFGTCCQAPLGKTWDQLR